jgi:hypothetical protein
MGMDWSRFGGLMAGVAAVAIFSGFSNGWVKALLIAVAIVLFAAGLLSLIHDLWSRPRLQIKNGGSLGREMLVSHHTESGVSMTSTTDFVITAVTAVPPPGALNVREFAYLRAYNATRWMAARKPINNLAVQLRFVARDGSEMFTIHGRWADSEPLFGSWQHQTVTVKPVLHPKTSALIDVAGCLDRGTFHAINDEGREIGMKKYPLGVGPVYLEVLVTSDQCRDNRTHWMIESDGKWGLSLTQIQRRPAAPPAQQ